MSKWKTSHLVGWSFCFMLIGKKFIPRYAYYLVSTDKDFLVRASRVKLSFWSVNLWCPDRMVYQVRLDYLRRVAVVEVMNMFQAK